MARGFVWVSLNVDVDNNCITKFLKLLLQYGYVWYPNDVDAMKIYLGRKEKEQFLKVFTEFLYTVIADGNMIEELDASVALGEIKDIYDHEYRRLLVRRNKKSSIPWFFLAHQLFRKRESSKNVSIQEFKRTELLSYYNHMIEADLLVISNRNLHLQAIHKEFLKFSKFITYHKHKKDFHVFLIPVFQHLYLLIRSHDGKSQADTFIRYCKHLNISPDVIQNLQSKELEELQNLIIGQVRMRVKLSSYAYHILMNWLRDSFSENSEMFNILRVLHENFHVDIYYDKDDEEFSGLKDKLLLSMNKFMEELEDWNRKRLKPKISAKTSKTPPSDVDSMAEKMSELDIETETPQTSETPKSHGTSLTSENNGIESNFEVNSSIFEMKESAKKYLDEVRRKYNSGELTMEQAAQALENMPDPDIAVSSDTERSDQGMDFQEDLAPTANENADTERSDQGMDFHEDRAPMADENADTERSDQEMDFHEDRAPMVDENAGNEEDGFQLHENAEPTDQDMNEDTTEGVENEELQGNAKDHYFKFNKSYKSNFHSAYPITFSGKDVLCSSDVSSDLSYLACGFESLKICTWRLGKNGFDLKLLGTLKGHKGIVYALSIDSNRKYLISGSHDHTVKIWDIEKSLLLSDISQHSAPVYAVCASPNSMYFLSASEDKRVVLFWYDEVYPMRVYDGHSMEAINCVRFHPNCAYFASASADGNVFLFKINNDSCPVRMFHKHQAKVSTLAFSPCGKYLASADVDGKLVIWDILKYEPIKIHEADKGIRSISFDVSGSFIAVLFYFKSWKVYSVEDPDTRSDIETAIEAKSVGVPKSVHFSECNKMLIIQYIDANKEEIAEMKEKTKITKPKKIKG